MDDFLRRTIIQDMRKRWMMSEERKQALVNARTSVLKIKKDGTVQLRTCKKTGKKVECYSHSYQCACCKGKGFTSSKVAVDHIEPVLPYNVQLKDIGDTSGFTLGQYVDRLWCPVSNLQVLCTDCHTRKTNIEKKIRAKWRAHKKDPSKPTPLPLDGRTFDDYII